MWLVKRLYVQTAYLIPDQKTAEREFGNLMKIDDNYEKIVVSMDRYAGGDYKGIRHLNILEFLA
jgi:predicted AAA+ superfamily ATPase